ncbi:actin maturation protease [Diorhabda sublineata]|uniref:actin maturation protease n=1 Tax=Diorhabda sublineata TaxID=1163346 RepID=UPI0024E174ED|nr:actin maturation protease [Diorhabda sublineata]
MEDFSWAKLYPEVYKVCTLFQMTEIANPIEFHYKKLDQFLQDGPQCGLVALAMCVGNPTKDSIQNLFETAKKYNFSNNGEMFSVDNMATLAKEVLPIGTEIKVYNGYLDNDFIKKSLLGGSIMLVPYDTEKDNSPGLCKGHKAHWAAICGGILTENDFYVLARHGKARNVAIWKLKVLANSNKQLLEFSPDRKFQDIVYKLPIGGISGPFGLKEKSILIQYKC